MTLGSKWFFREGGVTLAISLMVSLAANLHHASAEPATEGAKVVPAPSISFSELQRLVGALPEGDESPARLIDEWLAGRDLGELSLEDVRWCLLHSLPNERDRRAFTATWTGMLKAPRTGSYVFSVSPINVNSGDRESVRHAIKVTLGEDGVLSTLPERREPEAPATSSRRGPNAAHLAHQWHWRSRPIKMQADLAVPVQVVLDYQAAAAASNSSPPSAILFWEGPGLERQPVGESFFSGPEGAPGGLNVEYAWKDAQGSPQAVVQQSPGVDYAWTGAARVAPTRPKLVAQLADRLWLLATDSKYLEKCEAGEAEHVYFQDYASTDYLSTARRQQFLELLVERPELLAQTDDEAVLRLYQKLRFGAEDAALDMLGQWMQQRADVAPEITVDFFEQNRRIYWELAALMARQLPEQVDQFRDDYLTMEDERCALPVAYTLTYGYLTVDRFASSSLEDPEHPEQLPSSQYQEWVELLTEKSSDKNLSDRLRTNWLLARAQAAEAISGIAPRENLLAGNQWLKEAQSTPENETDYLRAQREEIARLVALNREAQAERLFEELNAALPQAETQAWKKQAESVFKVYRDRRQETRRLTRTAYVDVLKRRRDRAAAKNDDASVARYDQLLSEAEEESK